MRLHGRAQTWVLHAEQPLCSSVQAVALPPSHQVHTQVLDDGLSQYEGLFRELQTANSQQTSVLDFVGVEKRKAVPG